MRATKKEQIKFLLLIWDHPLKANFIQDEGTWNRAAAFESIKGVEFFLLVSPPWKLGDTLGVSCTILKGLKVLNGTTAVDAVRILVIDD